MREYKGSRKYSVQICKVLVEVLFVFLCVFFLRFNTINAYGAEIKATEFEDEGLYNLLTERYDTDNDGVLEQEEAESADYIIITMPTDIEGITSLKGIEYFKNITTLIIQGVPTVHLQDISVIGQLKKLNCLRLDEITEIRDYSVFYELSQLEMLIIQTSNISDISFFENMPELKDLNIWNCDRIIDGSVIGQLSELKSLSLRCSNMENIEFISKLYNLEEVNLSDMKVYDYSVLENSAETIKSLYISNMRYSMEYTGMFDVQVIGKMHNLEMLYLEEMGLRELPDMTALSNLSSVHIRYNYITYDEALKKLPQTITSMENWENDVGLYEQWADTEKIFVDNRSTDKLLSRIMIERLAFSEGAYILATDESISEAYNTIKDEIYCNHTEIADVKVYDIEVYIDKNIDGNVVPSKCVPTYYVDVVFPIERGAKKIYTIYQIGADGGIIKLSSSVDTDIGNLYFKTNSFGTFCIVAEDYIEDDIPKETTTNSNVESEEETTTYNKEESEEETTTYNNEESEEETTIDSNVENEGETTTYNNEESEEETTIDSNAESEEETTTYNKESDKETTIDSNVESEEETTTYNKEESEEETATYNKEESEEETTIYNKEESEEETTYISKTSKDINHTAEIIIICAVVMILCAYEFIRHKNGKVLFILIFFLVCGMSMEVRAEEIPEAEFEDNGFYQLMLQWYDEDKDGKLETEETESVTSLDIYLNGDVFGYYIEGITSLKGIEYFKNLTYLSIGNEPKTPLTDISFLQYLTKLESLYIRQQYYIADFSVMYKLPQLKTLDLSRTNVEDISFLESMPGLQSLTLYNAKYVTDGSPIGNLTELTSISISGSRISDISYLKNCSKLEMVCIEDCEIEDISGLLTSKETIQILMMGNYHYDYSMMITADDLEFLREFTELAVLIIEDSHLVELPDLTHIDSLKSVCISGNHLTLDEYVSKMPSSVFFNPDWRIISGIDKQTEYRPEEIGMQEHTLKDSNTSIVAEGKFVNDAYIEAANKEESEHEDVVEHIQNQLGSEIDIKIYDISVYKFYTLDDTEKVGRTEKSQPKGMAKVVLPVSTMSGQIRAYRQEEDGTVTELECSVENGKIIFYTEHFSIFSIAATLLIDDVDKTPDKDVQHVNGGGNDNNNSSTENVSPDKNEAFTDSNSNNQNNNGNNMENQSNENDTDSSSGSLSDESLEDNTSGQNTGEENSSEQDNNGQDDEESDSTTDKVYDKNSMDSSEKPKVMSEENIKIIDLVVIVAGIIGMIMCEVMRRKKNH